jgi:hypothetical protein
MVKITFWGNCLCERGTTIALYDYVFSIGPFRIMKKGDWNAYRDYSPENVMDIFKRVFIEN